MSGIGRQFPELNRNLDYVIERGAVARRHRFLADLRLLLMPALLSAILQCLIYSLFILRASRGDWNSAIVVCSVLAVMPFVVSTLLAGLRSHEFPFTLSALLTLVVHNFGVVMLSAMRIPMSYSALFWAAPVAVVAMILGATRLNRANHEKVAILEFPGAPQLARALGGDVTVIGQTSDPAIGYDRLLIDGETHHQPFWNNYLTRALMRGTLITPWFAMLERRTGRVSPEHFDVTHVAYSPTQIYYTKIKRLLDILLVVASLPITLPLGGLVWLYIRLIDGGPVLFVQTRRGYAGKNFRMLKFRTMRLGTHGGSTASGDSRILPGCGVLRRFRIDELPQLINILRGDMSWIGPRPVSLEIARYCEKLAPNYVARYLVLPGITGWAQVRYGYAGNPDEELEKLGYDLFYLKRISLDLDLEIALRTVRTLLTRQGAR